MFKSNQNKSPTDCCHFTRWTYQAHGSIIRRVVCFVVQQTVLLTFVMTLLMKLITEYRMLSLSWEMMELVQVASGRGKRILRKIRQKTFTEAEDRVTWTRERKKLSIEKRERWTGSTRCDEALVITITAFLSLVKRCFDVNYTDHTFQIIKINRPSRKDEFGWNRPHTETPG